MTIEAPPARLTRGAAPLLRHGAVALALWLVGIAGLTLAFEPARDVLVLVADGDAAIQAIGGADVAILSGGGRVWRLAGRSRGFVRALYAGGALLVVPAGRAGCLGLSRGTGTG